MESVSGVKMVAAMSLATPPVDLIKTSSEHNLGSRVLTKGGASGGLEGSSFVSTAATGHKMKRIINQNLIPLIKRGIHQLKCAISLTSHRLLSGQMCCSSLMVTRGSGKDYCEGRSGSVNSSPDGTTKRYLTSANGITPFQQISLANILKLSVLWIC